MSVSIYLSDPEINAIGAGRKTLLMALLKPQPEFDPEFDLSRELQELGEVASREHPFQPGQVVWVREAYCHRVDPVTSEVLMDEYLYRADGQEVYRADGDGGVMFNKDGSMTCPWSSAVNMPEEAARIFLEITGIQGGKKIQAITEEEMLREGLGKLSKDGCRTWKYGIPDKDGLPGTDNTGWPWNKWSTDPFDAYRRFWNSRNAWWKARHRMVNGKRTIVEFTCYPWSEEDAPQVPAMAKKRSIPCRAYPNPWVFPVEFKRVRKNAKR